MSRRREVLDNSLCNLFFLPPSISIVSWFHRSLHSSQIYVISDNTGNRWQRWHNGIVHRIKKSWHFEKCYISNLGKPEFSVEEHYSFSRNTERLYLYSRDSIYRSSSLRHSIAAGEWATNENFFREHRQGDSSIRWTVSSRTEAIQRWWNPASM